jgi:hypothetical protein
VKKFIVALAVVMAWLFIPTSAIADTPDELPDCHYYSVNSMPLGGGTWGTTWKTVPVASACEDINLGMMYDAPAGTRVRVDRIGVTGKWDIACVPCVISANIPNGTRYRVVFDAPVQLFGLYE